MSPRRRASLSPRSGPARCPSSAVSAALPWAVGKDYPEFIDGQKAGPRSAAVFATFVNVAGIPAISVPAGMGASQLPIGMQLAAGFGQDMRVLELARELESAAPWPLCAPAFT